MVKIEITRQVYTDRSIVSSIRVKSTKISSGFSGYALENSKAGSNFNKTPTPSGTYRAKVRTDGHLGWRIELRNVPGHTHIEIHIGNYPDDSHGCFLPGITKAKNAVGHSRSAISQIKKIVESDGSGIISIRVVGSNKKK